VKWLAENNLAAACKEMAKRRAVWAGICSGRGQKRLGLDGGVAGGGFAGANPATIFNHLPS